jgi:hypothetical protein
VDEKDRWEREALEVAKGTYRGGRGVDIVGRGGALNKALVAIDSVRSCFEAMRIRSTGFVSSLGGLRALMMRLDGVVEVWFEDEK